ncbi:MAG: sulfite exporter TauE/SafE family protein [Betaproteobacteria bacterium]|nr:sulfite exporter TauE/SafE family protein [Betaproteobacteria bacterium]
MSPLVPFGWAIFTGVVFSLVGAAGGILAVVGHISVLGLADANMVKTMSQVVTIVTPLCSVPLYHRQRRVVFFLGLLFGVGGIAGALIGSWASARYLLDLHAYRQMFGLLTLAIAGRLLYELTPRYRASQRVLGRSVAAFESAMMRCRAEGRLGELKRLGVLMIERSVSVVRFQFFGETFAFNPSVAVIAGLVIGVVSSSFGVGGGFLLVPFLISVLRFPVFIVAGTAVFSVLLSSTASVGSYLNLGSRIDWPLMAIEVAGVALGSLAGAHLSTFMKGQWLRSALTLILIYIGMGYVFGEIIYARLGIRVI